MRTPSRTGRSDGSANMTPMIDVVFLLIIFFLVSSHLARQESRIPLDLPVADASVDQPPPNDVFTINVLPDGAWQVSGTEVDRAMLDRLLQSHHGEHGPDAAVRIRTDRSVAYGQVEPLLRAASGAGLWNASFAVYQETR
ncbi:ExbD/TolR family protein [Rosistilla ulvae]|nr:biopolymer transporter ExbD [Rosistilla ulvae]